MKLGFIGLGIMGEAMCSNLLKEYKSVNVYDINQNQVQKLYELGATPKNDVIDLTIDSDIIITMLPKDEQVTDVIKAILPYLNESKTIIDMSTISPKTSMTLSNQVKNMGSKMIDAPVVKSKQAALSGDLGIYVGGDYDTFIKVLPILKVMGENIIYLGDSGKGLIMKLAHNMLVGQIQNGVNEMLVMALNAGLNFEDIKIAISYGGGQNFYLDSKANAINNRDYTTNFSINNMAKDLKLVKEWINENNLKLNGLDNIYDIYLEAIKENYGSLDFSSTFNIVEEKSKSES